MIACDFGAAIFRARRILPDIDFVIKHRCATTRVRLCLRNNDFLRNELTVRTMKSAFSFPKSTLCQFAFAFVLAATVFQTAGWAQQVNWIWSEQHALDAVPLGSGYFRKAFRLVDPELGQLQIAADDEFIVFLNGNEIGKGGGAERLARFDISDQLIVGVNVIAVEVRNTKGTSAGLAAAVVLKEKNEAQWRMQATDATWKANTAKVENWQSLDLADSQWPNARIIVQGNKASSSQTTEPTTDSTAKNVERQENAAEILPFKVNQEFEISTVLGNAAGSIIAMEFNEFGQLILSQEGGPLFVARSDTTADKQTVEILCDKVKSCQGIVPLNGDLFVTGLGPEGMGLYRLGQRDDKGRYTDVQTLVRFTGPIGEHGPHGVRLGLDGYLYVVLGNASQVDGAIDDASPYKTTYEGDLVARFEDPGGHAAGVKAPGGTIIRVSIDGKQIQTIAGGLRNVYDMTFNETGEFFVHESDMEADLGLGWYRSNAVYHVQSGAELGWRSGWAKIPAYQPDVIAPILDTGRGSPTGCVIYDHDVFPKKYRGTLFLCDWSEGKILACRLKPQGASYTAESEVFLEGEPLNVTDIAVGPNGNLYFCTGGRGTQGGVYRVAWKGTVNEADRLPQTNADRIIRQPQIDSAWARQALAQLKINMGHAWGSELRKAVLDSRRAPSERIRALHIMTLYGPVPSKSTLLTLRNSSDYRLRGTVARLMGLEKAESVETVLKEMLADDHPSVRRIACESLVRIGAKPKFEDLQSNLASTDASEAFAARRLLETIPVSEWKAQALASTNHRVFNASALALIVADPSLENSYAILARASELMEQFVSDDNFKDMLRVIQLSLVRAEVDYQLIPAFTKRLVREFPTGNANLNQELAGILAYLQATDTNGRYAEYFQTSEDPHLIKLRVAMYLQSLGKRLDANDRYAIMDYLERAMVRSSQGSYRAYVSQAASKLAETFGKEDYDTILRHGENWPISMVRAFYMMPIKLDAETIQRLKEIDQASLKRDDNVSKTMRTGVIAVLSRSNDPEALAYVRSIWTRDEDRRSDVAIGLSENPGGENWSYLVSTLSSLDDKVVTEVMLRLRDVNRKPTQAKHYREVIEVASRLRGVGAHSAIALLEHWADTRVAEESGDWKSSVEAWKKWYEEAYPDAEPIRIEQEATKGKWSSEDILQYLEKNPSVGNVSHGQRMFAVANCVKCHRHGAVGESVGPDLSSVAKRFSKREIVQAIVDPSKVVSDRYRAKKITTVDGMTMVGTTSTGLDGSLVVLNSDGEKVKLAANEIDDIRDHDQSSMPEGLLDSMTLKDVADLVAYLSKSPRDRVASTIDASKK